MRGFEARILAAGFKKFYSRIKTPEFLPFKYARDIDDFSKYKESDSD